MNTRVNELRLSFVWSEFDDKLLQDTLPRAPFAFLGRDTTFAEVFTQLQAYRAAPEGLIPPWPRHRGKNYWEMYLDRDPQEVDPWRAWKHAVPLRLRLEPKLEAAWLPGRVGMEGFFYPHGRALVIEARLFPPEGGNGLRDVVSLAHDVRSEKQFAVEIDGSGSRRMKLDSIAAALLGRLRETAMGPSGAGGPISPAYTIATFVRLEGVDPAVAVEEQGEVHRALEAVTRWPSAWSIAPLPPLASTAINDPGFPDGHVHYVRRRGRASWLSDLAAPGSEKHRKLCCYHRNQTFAAMQVESLRLLVSRTAQRLRTGAEVPLTQEHCAKHAAGVLGRLHGGAKGTYRSLACREHIRKADLVDDLNYVRQTYTMVPVHD